MIPCLLIAILALAVPCDAFSPVHHLPKVNVPAPIGVHHATSSGITGEQLKTNFLESLDRPYNLNKRSEQRTQLLNDVIVNGDGLPNPGSKESFSSVAPGVWRVCYAPHMTIMAGVFQGEFSVQVSCCNV